MMIDKRLIGTVGEGKRYIAGNVLAQWCAGGKYRDYGQCFPAVGAALSSADGQRTVSGVRDLPCGGSDCPLRVQYHSQPHELSGGEDSQEAAGNDLPQTAGAGGFHREKVKTSEVVQVAVEGVDQLETYFGSYLPQFFLCHAGALTLFAVLAFI